ncbi:hypothetical protein E2562_033029, partial [Oryza meyeriana var. granulata]
RRSGAGRGRGRGAYLFSLSLPLASSSSTGSGVAPPRSPLQLRRHRSPSHLLVISTRILELVVTLSSPACSAAGGENKNSS